MENQERTARRLHMGPNGRLALLGLATALLTAGCSGVENPEEATDAAPVTDGAETAPAPEAADATEATKAAVKSATLSVAELAGLVEVCRVPDPKVPSSAFLIEQSDPLQKDEDYWLQDYWMRYQCKEVCTDWRECQVPAYTQDGGEVIFHGRQPELPKQSIAFVVDGMGGHLAYTTDGGEKTIFTHGGAGGVGYDPSVALLEQRGTMNTVTVSWAMGYAPPAQIQIPWGWYTRSSAAGERIPKLNRRVAAAIAWSHENLAGASTFATRACSMGAAATFGAVLWHGLDDIIDYQALGGGPPIYDINAGCGRRSYEQGYCNLDANVACTTNEDCKVVSDDSVCNVPEAITTAWIFESVINHVHATTACHIDEESVVGEGGSEPYAPFDESSMMAADDGDWDIDHPIDMIADVGGEYDPNRLGGGDEHWALGHFMTIFNKMNMQPGSEKQWHAFENSSHCESFGSEAVMDIIMARMAAE